MGWIVVNIWCAGQREVIKNFSLFYSIEKPCVIADNNCDLLSFLLLIPCDQEPTKNVVEHLQLFYGVLL